MLVMQCNGDLGKFKYARVCKAWRDAAVLWTQRERRNPTPISAKAHSTILKAKHSRKIWAATKAKRGLTEFQLQKMQRASSSFFKTNTD